MLIKFLCSGVCLYPEPSAPPEARRRVPRVLWVPALSPHTGNTLTLAGGQPRPSVLVPGVVLQPLPGSGGGSPASLRCASSTCIRAVGRDPSRWFRALRGDLLALRQYVSSLPPGSRDTAASAAFSSCCHMPTATAVSPAPSQPQCLVHPRRFGVTAVLSGCSQVSCASRSGVQRPSVFVWL